MRKKRTIQQSNIERACVYAAAAGLLVLSWVLYNVMCRAFALDNSSIPYTNADLIPAYNNIKNALNSKLATTMLNNFHMCEGIVRTAIDSKAFMPMTKGLASLLIATRIALNIVTEVWRGNISIRAVTRPILMAMIAFILILNIDVITAAVDDAGEHLITAANTSNTLGTGGEAVASGIAAGMGQSSTSVDTAIRYLIVDPTMRKDRGISLDTALNHPEDVDEDKLKNNIDYGYSDGWKTIVETIEDKSKSEDDKKAVLDKIPEQCVDDFCGAAAIITGILDIPASMGTLLIFIQMIERTLRIIFMPIALANVTLEGSRSPAIRFMKGYLGCYLKIGACFMIGIMTSRLSTSAMALISNAGAGSGVSFAIGGANIPACAIPFLMANLVGVYLMMQASSLVAEMIR